MKKLLFLTTLFALLISAEAKFKFAPDSIERYSHLQFTWWGFKVYKAEIWTPKAQKPDFKDKIILHINFIITKEWKSGAIILLRNFNASMKDHFLGATRKALFHIQKS